jgi:hypothetical protein
VHFSVTTGAAVVAALSTLAQARHSGGGVGAAVAAFQIRSAAGDVPADVPATEGGTL